MEISIRGEVEEGVGGLGMPAGAGSVGGDKDRIALGGVEETGGGIEWIPETLKWSGRSPQLWFRDSESRSVINLLWWWRGARDSMGGRFWERWKRFQYYGGCRCG